MSWRRGDLTIGAALPCLLLGSVLLASCGGGDKGTGPSTSWPAPTATGAGAPLGPVVTATIGAAGGTLQSDDGAIRLDIPAGALGGDTEIGIQRISALSPGAVGDAIRLTPHGLQFTAPVTIRMPYDSAMIEGTAPEFLTIVTQQPDGTWLLLPASDVLLDTLTRTLVTQTTHFSDYSRLEGYQIRPPGAEVDPGKSVGLQVKLCTTVVEQSGGNFSAYAVDCAPPPPASSGPGDDLPPLPSAWVVDGNSWEVNGSRGGNARVGFVAGDREGGEYLAPQAPPAANPVAVSITVRNRRTRETKVLVSHIKVRDTCGPSLRAGTSVLLRDLCGPAALEGSSRSVVDDAHPLFRIDAHVTWVYDSATSVPGSLLSYKAVGTASFTAINTCIVISPSQHSWQLDDPQSGGTLTLSLPDSTWDGVGIALWPATYTDTCDPNSTPGQAAAGGGWFAGSGRFPSSLVIAGTQSVGGQTFTFDFGPQVSIRAGTTQRR